MNVEMRRKAELFYKAQEDIWLADYAWKGSPNLAVWLCTQAVEKTMKGYLFCFGKEYGFDHNLNDLLDAINQLVKLPQEIKDHIAYLGFFQSKLRYRNMKTDPTVGDTKVAISRAKIVMEEFAKISDISSYVAEAREVHAKIMKSIAEEEST